MKKQHVIYGAVVLVVVGAALTVAALWRGPNNANFPEGTDWLCTNQGCGNHFKLTMKQLGEHYKAHYGQLPKCPKCGHDAVRAWQCANCGKVFPQTRGIDACPYCGKPLAAPPG
jgi:rRNA maturation endonuclease Nob1